MLSNDIAIDFGTQNTRIYIKGKGLVLDEPSAVAIDSYNGEVITVGNDAAVMFGKTPPSVTVVFPLEGGAISDATLAEELLKLLLRKVTAKTFLKPRMFISLPASSTDVEARAMRDAAIIAGARSVCIMKAPIAAAIGAKCDVMLSRGLMIADIGAGLCEFASISSGQIASLNASNTAGGSFTDAIIHYFSDRYLLSIGYPTAEKCKKEIGCVFQKDKNISMTLCGIDLRTGLPKEISVSSEELREALMPIAAKLTEDLKNAVDSVPSELLGDILEDGILLTGAGSKIDGLLKRLKIDTELKLYLAPESEYVVIRGLAALAENINQFPESLYTIYHS